MSGRAFVFSLNHLNGQFNLVPNPSFETCTICPIEDVSKIKIIDDLLDENLPDPEMALINLSNPTNAILGDAQATLRIFDNDPIDDLPNVIVDDVSVVEGNVAEFKVSFDADLVMPMNVKLALMSGSATIGVDFINSLIKFINNL